MDTTGEAHDGTRSRPEVAVVGTLNVDLTVRVGRLPRPGESVVGDVVAAVPGGKGANQAVAAARMGARTALVGCLGEDAAGTTVLATLATEPGLDLTGVTRVDTPTGSAFVTIDDSGGNTVVSARGANARLDDELVHRHGRCIAEAAVLLVQLGVPPAAVTAALDVARSVGTLVVLDPSPAEAVTDELLRRADVCTPNETEAEQLTGVRVDDDDGVARAAAVLLERGCGAVVVTLGARGAYLATTGGSTRWVAPVPVTVLDPTGAGDAFAGSAGGGARAWCVRRRRRRRRSRRRCTRRDPARRRAVVADACGGRGLPRRTSRSRALTGRRARGRRRWGPRAQERDPRPGGTHHRRGEHHAALGRGRGTTAWQHALATVAGPAANARRRPSRTTALVATVCTQSTRPTQPRFPYWQFLGHLHTDPLASPRSRRKGCPPPDGEPVRPATGFVMLRAWPTAW